MRAAGLAAGAGALVLASLLAAAPAVSATPGDRPWAAPTTTQTHGEGSPKSSPRTTPKSSPKTTPKATTTKPKPTEKPQEPPAQPKPQCNKLTGQPASAITIEPWAQRRLDFEQAWRITQGRGVTVAVVDSGVEAGHPQLRGRVDGSYDATNTTTADCFGHGTEVAGIIAGADLRSKGVPFVGVAPQARLLNAKFTSGQSSDDNTLLPRAITWAAEHGAKVINVSVDAPDTAGLRRAVQAAQRRDALIVASAGNVPQDQRGKESAAYPASYPGVLSVAAVDQAGTISNFSNHRTRIDVSAPGQDVISTLGGGYTGGLQGTSFGAPYAAGVAALVRASHPRLTYQQVINRILITAEGGNGQGSGHGMISPMQAVSAVVSPDARPDQAGRGRVLGGAVPIARPEPVDHRTRGIGLAVAGGALLLALLVAFAGAVIPFGRARGWKPGRLVPPAAGDGDRD
ncbi:S8 family peptidase [Actinomadura roseirufa]|uniref:S8 family peptidase n=1 Tax=Actinomadura roseirufa TaxID=2094049 RepID=UPI00104100DC|nr:S8 family serine peptidase [Actinomadura roseirufa]